MHVSVRSLLYSSSTHTRAPHYVDGAGVTCGYGDGPAALELQWIQFQVWCDKDTWILCCIQRRMELQIHLHTHSHMHTHIPARKDGSRNFQADIHNKLAAWLGIRKTDYIACSRNYFQWLLIFPPLFKLPCL